MVVAAWAGGTGDVMLGSFTMEDVAAAAVMANTVDGVTVAKGLSDAICRGAVLLGWAFIASSRFLQSVFAVASGST